MNDSDWGGGKGLVWEVINELKKDNEITIRNINQKDNELKKLFYHMGGYQFNRIDIRYDEYDRLIVFPGHLLWAVPRELWKKTVALGPDSLVLNATSLKRATLGFIRRNFVRGIFVCLNRINECLLISLCLKYIVVGNTDKKYIRYTLKCLGDNNLNKVKFLHHPLLSNEQYDILSSKYDDNIKEKRFIFAGDLARKYQEACIKPLAYALQYKVKRQQK